MTSKELKQTLIDLGLCKDNEYLTKYVNIIVSNVKTTKQIGYDKHHIIPRYYYKNNNLEVNNSKSNLVYLSRSDHILAHLYLYFCSTLDEYLYSNAYAVIMFIHQKHISHKNYSNIITYDLEAFISQNKNDINIVAKKFSELQSKRYLGKSQNISESERDRRRNLSKTLKQNLNKTGLRLNGQYMSVPNNKVDDYLKQGAILGRGPHTKESNEKNRQSHLGKKVPHTKEWNEAISRSNKGRKLSEECKQKISNALKGNTEKCGHIRGKIAINNGKIYRYVSIEEYESNYKHSGWVKGIGNLSKSHSSVKNKIRINNEFGAKYVTIEEWETKYSKEGWHRGYDWKK